jgi:hypothetical protein
MKCGTRGTLPHEADHWYIAAVNETNLDNSCHLGGGRRALRLRDNAAVD